MQKNHSQVMKKLFLYYERLVNDFPKKEISFSNFLFSRNLKIYVFQAFSIQLRFEDPEKRNKKNPV